MDREHKSRRSSRIRIEFYSVIFIVVIASGIRAFRLGANSLWFDEATIWQITHGTLSDIIANNLALNSAPPLYPILVRLVEDWWGSSEAQLRALSLLAGILSVPAFTLLARQWLSWKGTLVATGLLALSPPMVYYSRELREYSLTTLATILMFYFVTKIVSGFTRWKTVVAYSALTLVAGWIAFGMVIIVASCQLVSLLYAYLQRSKRVNILVAVTSLSAFIGLGSSYLLALRPMVLSRSMTFDYLGSAFVTRSEPISVALQIWSNTLGLLDFGFGSRLASLGAACALIGIGTFLSSDFSHRVGVLNLVLPLVIVVCLSILRLYPYGGIRQDIFLLPMIFIVAAAGLEQILTILIRTRAMQSLLVIGLVAIAMKTIVPMYSADANGENLRPAIEYLAKHVSPGDAVYVYYGAAPAFQYYLESEQIDFHKKDVALVIGNSWREDPDRYMLEVSECFRLSTRCWLVFSHTYDSTLSEQSTILDRVATRAVQLDRFPIAKTDPAASSVGTSLFLYGRQ